MGYVNPAVPPTVNWTWELYPEDPSFRLGGVVVDGEMGVACSIGGQMTPNPLHEEAVSPKSPLLKESPDVALDLDEPAKETLIDPTTAEAAGVEVDGAVDIEV